MWNISCGVYVIANVGNFFNAKMIIMFNDNNNDYLNYDINNNN
jgi:hypothetical protein